MSEHDIDEIKARLDYLEAAMQIERTNGYRESKVRVVDLVNSTAWARSGSPDVRWPTRRAKSS